MPNYKPGKEQTEIEGWRPVNLVDTLSKPIERVMFNQITDFMIQNNLIDADIHGNRKGYSTQT